MLPIAHSPDSDGRAHSLLDHLRNVGQLTRAFSEAFGAGDVGYWMGLWHDLGKIATDFQEYITSQKQVRGPDHSTAGAVAAAQALQPLAIPILGHHGGLPDLEAVKRRLSTANDSVQQATAAWLKQMGQAKPKQLLQSGLPSYLMREGCPPAKWEFFIRMLFSALVDADFLDTEAHFDGGKAQRRGGWQKVEGLWPRLEASQVRLSGQKPDTLNQVRHEVYQDCLRAAQIPPGIFSLTVPTGGGKTRSAVAFALRHALLYGLRRVIVAIPYTSIIEQAVDIYRGIFGQDAVLEHHSAVDWDESPGSTFPGTERARLASENWDAPIIVTTTVQLFESLFASKPSRCRKLHNIARSVIILDEVQTLPLGLLEPVLDALQTLCDHYRVTVVLCTATPPAFLAGPYLKKGLRDVREIVPDPKRHFEALKRVRYQLPGDGQQWSWAAVAHEMRAAERCLAIVNTKADAISLLDALDDPNALHLSTSLCGAHRRHVLREVRRRLSAGEACRLVSTQVVEAGVDLDFPLVLRAMGPLDSIVQAAGRCNREGSLAEGRVVVFVAAEGGTPGKAYRTATDTAYALLSQGKADLDDPALFQTYFQRLFQTVDPDQKHIQALRASFNFPEVGHQFRIIEDDTVPAVVNYQGRTSSLLKAAGDPVEPRRRLLRRLQPYVVNLRRRHLPQLERDGLVSEMSPGLWEWRGAYDSVRGISVEKLPTEELIV